MIIALLGASGHMGIRTLEEFLKIKEVDCIKVLLQKGEKRNKLVKRLKRKNRDRILIYYGDISNKNDLLGVVSGSSYLFNLAAVIPPKSDKHPELSYLANEVGTNILVEILEENPLVKFIDITSVALYGHRNSKHPFERVGDPLMPSVYDVYALHKLRGEYKVLESNIPYFVVIRQTAMIYKEMLIANMADGLMFHTPFNDPLEWSLAEESGLLMANIVREDLKGNLNYDNFWRKVFNLGSNHLNRISGYQTLEGGFKLIGGSTSFFFDPSYNASRNFHGGFYYDGDKLEKLFKYQNGTIDEYWLKIKKKYPYFGLAKIIPKGLIKRFAIMRLFKDNNSPMYWYKHKDIPRLTAFFGGIKEYEDLAKDWSDFSLWDYEKERDNIFYKPIDYGFDIEKEDKDITIEDLRNVAKKHGGRLLSEDFKTGDVYAKLKWENSDKEEFISRPYTVLRGGHWFNPLYVSYVWDFDRLSKKDEIFSSFWYDSHKKDENNCYYMDENYEAKLK